MLPNEVFALECIARYAKEGLDVKKGGVHDGYPDEFAHCPIPRPEGQKDRLAGDLGYYLTFYDHQKQGLLQSVDMRSRCYMIQKVYLYLNTMPPGHEELRVIYDKFNKNTEEQNKKISKALIGSTRTEEQKKNISVAKIGKKHPMYGRTGVLNPRSRAIIAIKPDGTKLHFVSIVEAARELGINRHHLSGRYLNPGKQPKRGKWKDYQFFYAK